MRAHLLPIHFPSFSARNLLGLFLALFALLGGALSAQTNPALWTSYRGDPARVIAESPWGSLTEEGLFLYLLITGHPRPDLYDHFTRSQDPAERKRLFTQVKSVVQDWALTMAFSQMKMADLSEDPIEKMRLRILLHPVHELIWIDRQVAPRVLIAFEDLLKYYIDHPEDYLEPQLAQVRYIFLPVDGRGANPAQLAPRREEARQRMDEIHNRILTGEISFADAARQYSKAPNAPQGGLTPPFGRGVWFPEFDRQTFRLQPGPDSYSSIFYGPDGVYLLLREGVDYRTIKPLVEVQESIHQTLFFNQIKERYTGELRRVTPPLFSVNRARVAHLMLPGESILRVGDFLITNDSFLDLHPENVIPGSPTPRQQYVSNVNRLENLERIAQENERRGWDGDVRMGVARQIAEAVRRRERRLEALLVPRLAIDRDEAIQFYETRKTHPAFAAFGKPQGSVIHIEITDPTSMGKGNLDRTMEAVRKAIAESRDRYSNVGLEQIALNHPETRTIPSRLIPTLIENELILAIGAPHVRVTRWDTGSDKKELPSHIAALTEKFEERLPELVDQGIRILPGIEGPNWVALYYAEKPDYSKRAIADIDYFPFYMSIVSFIQNQTWQSHINAMVRSERLRLLFSEQS
jgi:hypothetical protein